VSRRASDQPGLDDRQRAAGHERNSRSGHARPQISAASSPRWRRAGDRCLTRTCWREGPNDHRCQLSSLAMSMRTINLEPGLPSLDEARRFLLAQIDAARKDGVRLLKVIHGYGSSGSEGVLCAGIRKSLRLRVKE